MVFFFIYVISPNAKQILQKDVTSKKNELNKLGRDLDLTEQACSPLKQSFDEYCPDIRRQDSEVKRLKNRYTIVNNQLQDRWGVVPSVCGCVFLTSMTSWQMWFYLIMETFH